MEEKLQEDLKQALLNKEDLPAGRQELKVSTLRMLLSELKNAQIAKGGDLSEEDFLSLVQKEIKKRNEAAAAFKQGGRQDLSSKEEEEAKILKIYLPDQLSTEELTKVVEDSINKLGAKSLSDMGRVMGVVMKEIKGRGTGDEVSRLVKEKLSPNPS